MIKIKNNILRKTVGVLLIILGIIGLFIPFVSGWFFIFIGLVVLESNYLKNIIEKIKLRLKQ